MRQSVFLIVFLFSMNPVFASGERLLNVPIYGGELRVLEKDDVISIEFCVDSGCVFVKNKLSESDYAEYMSFGAEDVDGDNNPEVFISSKGMVNSCSEFYKFDKAGLVLNPLELNGSQLRLCDFKKYENYIVSSYRSGPQWNEEIYRVDGGLKYLFKDECTGCDYVKRVYADGRAEVVSTGEEFKNRKKLNAKVVVDKAVLYSEPSSRTKMYLVKGDVAEVVDYVYSDQEWFNCVYTTNSGKKIQKWIAASDIDIF